MGNCDRAAFMLPDQRLCIFKVACAGSGITDMPDDCFTIELFDSLVGKDLVHQAHIFVLPDFTVQIGGDSAAFLAAVLQGVQAEIGNSGGV